MEAAANSDGLDGSRVGELLHRAASERAVDLVVLNERVDGDDLHLLGHLLDELVVDSLGEDDLVVLLLTELALGPLRGDGGGRRMLVIMGTMVAWLSMHETRFLRPFLFP